MDDLPWFTESYFSKDPATSTARALYSKIFGVLSFMTIVVMMAVLPIYWGALWQTPAHAHNLHGWVVDLDGGNIGSFITEAFVNATGPATQMTWRVVPSSQFPNGVSDFEELLVHKEKAWAIVSINPGASASLAAAASSADASYNGSSAVTFYGVEARNENAYNNATNLGNIATNSPQVLTQPAFYTTNNLRPFDVPVATAVSFVGLIYLLILSFLIAVRFFLLRIDVTHLEDRLSLPWLVAMRIVNPVIVYFFVSAFYALISLAFQTPFTRVFGHSGFVIYWMMAWMAMCALGFALEAMLTLLTPRFMSFFLILWVVSNVSVCLFPIELLPGVYRYGYGSPFYNVSRTVRAIVFGTKNDIGLNFGVQFAWIGISIVTITFFSWTRRRAAIREHDRALRDAASNQEEKV
ncbi:hypothetical protein OF83DRAFT_1166149 [Amylostereum chailletii]|nr:hypothetical protein OF83DRAFT_1166149 [Amylostereum chailletii]